MFGKLTSEIAFQGSIFISANFFAASKGQNFDSKADFFNTRPPMFRFEVEVSKSLHVTKLGQTQPQGERSRISEGNCAEINVACLFSFFSCHIPPEIASVKRQKLPGNSGKVFTSFLPTLS